VLRNNGADNLTVAAGAQQFVFATGLAGGAAYAVTVQTQPAAPTQDCVVGNGSGMIAAANVTNVTVTCTTRSFKVGGTVTGLTGAGLTLRDVAGTVVSVSAGGSSFQFPAAQLSGSTYFVAIASQPAGGQVCTLSNGAGVVGGADTSIDVLCNSGAAKFVYAPDGLSGFVNALRVDAGTGTMSTVSGSPFTTGQNPQAIAATPSGAFLYVVSPTPGTVAAFAVNATSGALTPVPGSPFTVTGGATTLPAIYLDPSGRFAYFQQSGAASFFGYSINPTSGALTAIPGSPFTVPNGTSWLGFDPLGRYAYTIGTSAAATFRLDTATGALSSVGTPLTITLTGGTVPRGLVHPAGTSLYGFSSTRFQAITIDLATGQLSSAGNTLDGSRFSRLDPRGKFLYLTGANTISGYAVSQPSGVVAPVPGSPFSAGTQTENFDIHPTGGYLYAPAVLGQGPVMGFAIDATTGALSPVPGSPIVLGQNSAPNVARVDASGLSLFVSSIDDDRIRKFAISPTDGSITLTQTVAVANIGNTGFLLVGTQ
jgi:6-phosphogluconolactonase (cycloisomerase 2 family)